MQKIGFCDKYSLTQAVLNGTKTMTRRLIPPKVVEYALNVYRQDYYSATFDYLNEQEALEGWLIIEKKSRYKLGEIVAVAQAYKDTGLFDIYRGPEDTKGWSNKLFTKPDLMPHRIQITGVRIERLQDISDEDCLKEGIIQSVDGVNMFTFDGWIKNGYQQYSYTTPREAFAALIDRPGVGRKGLWESNPFVVVYEFKLIK